MGNIAFGRKMLLLASLLLWGCASPPPPDHTVSFTPIMEDTRSDDEIEALLPESAFDQDEFPARFVVHMMHRCTSANMRKNKNNIFPDAIDPFCACVTQKTVHEFTMVEYMEADKAHWKKKNVPDALHKKNVITAQCLQGALK